MCNGGSCLVAVEIDHLREQLNVQLTQNQQTEAKFQQELAASQQRLQAQQASSSAQQTQFEARIKELQSAQAEMEQQVTRLTEALAEETRRRVLRAGGRTRNVVGRSMAMDPRGAGGLLHDEAGGRAVPQDAAAILEGLLPKP